MKKIIFFFFFLTSCATQPANQSFDPPGFFSGLIHGLLIVFSLLASIFSDVRIYSFPNSGGWYDFGYVLGILIFFTASNNK